MSKLLVPDVTPQWFLNLPKDALVSAKEAARLFGYASAASFHKCVANGSFPSADVARGATDGYKRMTYFWKVPTLRNEIRRRRRIDKGEVE